MKKFWTIIAVGFLCVLLLLIRAYEDVLFYDPLLDFFKGDYNNFPVPDLDLLKLNLGVVLRYVFNTGISLGILWFIFKDSEIIKLSVLLYALLFVLLLMVFNFILYTSEGVQNQLPLFYVRRFLIQPIFLLVLLPAFYFQKKKLE